MLCHKYNTILQHSVNQEDSIRRVLEEMQALFEHNQKDVWVSTLSYNYVHLCIDQSIELFHCCCNKIR